MISVNDLKNGLTLELDNGLWSVVEFLHVKPGKGAAFVRTTIKNVLTGKVLERTYNPSEKINDISIERKEMMYLYNEGGLYYFMDNETYDQIPFNYDSVKEALNFIAEESYSEKYGARNMRRYIERNVEDSIANLIIDSMPSKIYAIAVTVRDGSLKIDSI